MLKIHCGIVVPGNDQSDVAKGYRLAYRHVLELLSDPLSVPSVNLPEVYEPEPLVTSIGLYDQEETYPDCTVQILFNSVTGEQSIGWWKNADHVVLDETEQNGSEQNHTERNRSGCTEDGCPINI